MMNTFFSAKLTRYGLMLLVLSFLCLMACGGGGEDGNTKAVAEDVDLDQIIQSEDWSAKITQPSEQAQLVGEDKIVYQAEKGIFIFVFVEVENLSQALQVVPRDLLTLVDSQGNEYKATKSAIQVAYILPRDMALLLDSPMKAGEKRTSLVIYDVPSDASGFNLLIKGSDETLAVGF